MKIAIRLLLPVLTLLTFAAGARGQAMSTAYSNLTFGGVAVAGVGGASAGGSTIVVADDLTYGSGSAGQAVSAFQCEIYSGNSAAASIIPTVAFWDTNGTNGGPGNLLGSHAFSLTTLATGEVRTLSYTVPPAEQFILPSGGTIWAGIFLTGTPSETADMINEFALPLCGPITVGSSQDNVFVTFSPVTTVASNPVGGLANYGGNPLANLGWELTTVAPGSLSVLHTFTGTGTDGALPYSSLLLAADGNYYGCTYGGGSTGVGTIFQLTTAGILSTIYSFTGTPDGAYPVGALVQGSDGLLYGTTYFGGANGAGTIFKIPTGGAPQALHVLYSFSATDSNGVNTDGKGVQANLIQGRDGNFYGLAQQGGANAAGTAFRITPTGTFTPLVSFGANSTAPNSPIATLIEDGSGNFIGASFLGGANTFGTIFKLTPAGALTVLDSLTADNSGPIGITLGADGNYYVTTAIGGSAEQGSAFVATPGVNGTGTKVADFGVDSKGEAPDGALLLASDGSFYGTLSTDTTAATNGGIFQLTPGTSGVVDFEELLNGTNGTSPQSALIQGSDGNLYGTTAGGGAGAGAQGVVFQLVTAMPPVVQFNLSEYSVNEFAGTASIRVDRVGGTDAFTVDFITSAGSTLPDAVAVGDTDYAAVEGTLSWAAGDQRPKFIPVQIIDRGLTDGSLRSLTITLTNPQGSNALGVQKTATLTINDTELNQPVITSATTANAKQGVAFSYQIVAQNHPTGFTVTGLTDGLSVNSTTGMISGTPTAAGTLALTLNATNGAGTGSTPLTVTVSPSAPVITTAATASAQAGQPFSYQITASNGPTGFAATGLPAGLSVNATGLISGAPTVSGSFSVTLSATNAAGTGVATLALMVTPAPVVAPMITSAGTASGQVGIAFAYQITAINSPASFAASGLPAGLSVDPTLGTISGTPTVSGTFSVALSALNTGGTGTATLTLSISPVPVTAPVITSATAASGQVGMAFSYQVTASNGPTGFEASGLPARLSIDPSTGMVSGTLTATAGVYTATLYASNAGGTGTATLTLTVAAASVVPTVSVAVSGDGHAQFGVENGVFVFLRTGDTSTALTVFYKLKGPAVEGVDYKKLSGTVTILAGSEKAKIKIKPLSGLLGAGTLKLKVVLIAPSDDSYVVGADAAKVKLIGQ